MASEHNATAPAENKAQQAPSPQHVLNSSEKTTEKDYDSTKHVSLQASAGGQVNSDEDAASTAESDTTPIKEGTIRRLWNWKPNSTRYDPDDPPKFTVWLNILFAAVSFAA